MPDFKGKQQGNNGRNVSRKHRRIDRDALAIIEELAADGADTDTILDTLRTQLRPGAHIPHRKTINSIVREFAALSASEPWTLGHGDASLILPVLRAYLHLVMARGGPKSDRDRYITRSEGRWIEHVARAAPTLGVFDIYRLARAYGAREATGAATYDLDALLAFRPWDETPIPIPSGTTTHRETYVRGVREGWIPPAPSFFMREFAGVEWHPAEREWATYTAVTYAHDPDAIDEATKFEEARHDVEATKPATSNKRNRRHQ